MRRGTPEALVATLILLLLGSYVWYTRTIATRLRADAKRTSEMYAQVYRAFGNNTPGAQDQALLDLSQRITDQGVPLILVNPAGVLAGHANLPFDKSGTLPDDDPRIRSYIAILAAQNPPVVDSLVGRIYFGDPPIVQSLHFIPVLQALFAAVVLLAGFYVIRTRGDAARERLWAGMARESAHQLGTPLSSLSGWIELLEERAHDATEQAAVTHMRSDLERLDRVAHRFERIGREPKFDEIDVGAVVERVASYFRARVPTLANTIAVHSTVAPKLALVRGDPVLLEWAVEVLTKNAIDALAGRGGCVRLSVEPNSEDAVVIRVSDDGPGIPRELRDRVFEPGFSTKKSGWGIGLSLAKRIVEENHGGKLLLATSALGATFEIILH
jgi:signal transduction histidine kinase